jgi:lysophospholipase L1-like esterase
MVCRRLVAASCVFQGTQPATVLELVRSSGGALGPVVVVNVGYNDWAAVYGVDKVMLAFEAAKVRTVVWVTLRETTSNYAQINSAIRKARRRWPSLVVADWDAYSRGRSWFISDGLHLTPRGAKSLSRMLRPVVLEGVSGS